MTSTVRITGGDGQATTAAHNSDGSITVSVTGQTVTPTPGPIRVGLSASPADVATTLAAFPGMATCRVFGPAGKGIPAWSASAMATLRKAGVTPWVSFKDWTDAAAVSKWLDTLPADVPAVWLTYNHEPEADLPSGTYRARWQVLAKTVRSHRHSARVTLVPIHTLYPARHKASDRYDADWTKWVGVWQQWHPTMPDGSYAGDLMGWDCYLDAAATAYEAPESFFRIPIGAAAQAGVPLVIPELGALRVPGDVVGTGRAAWITACANHLRANGVKAVVWWHATGTNGKDYRLSDEPSARAWRDAIAG